MSFLSVQEIYLKKKSGERVAFLLRHAERRHILKTDKDFGAYVPLSERGEEQALDAGRELAVFKGSAFYASSPVFRCAQTASFIAKRRGDGNFADPEKIVKIPRLAEYYVADYKIYEHLLLTGFYPAICQFVSQGRVDGFLPLAETSEELLKEILQKSSADFNVFLTHDAWIVPFLTHFTDVRFAENRWLNFLSGAAVFFDEGSLKPRCVLPVKFLGDGYLYF
ncbi:MAG: phosphoglycerate mutase family protein [Fibrobacteraceae bacterium]|nr:phosphoglycerate mutase family protein [Fibrobacteraceae bacterium]